MKIMSNSIASAPTLSTIQCSYSRKTQMNDKKKPNPNVYNKMTTTTTNMRQSPKWQLTKQESDEQKRKTWKYKLNLLYKTKMKTPKNQKVTKDCHCMRSIHNSPSLYVCISVVLRCNVSMDSNLYKWMKPRCKSAKLRMTTVLRHIDWLTRCHFQHKRWDISTPFDINTDFGQNNVNHPVQISIQIYILNSNFQICCSHSLSISMSSTFHLDDFFFRFCHLQWILYFSFNFPCILLFDFWLNVCIQIIRVSNSAPWMWFCLNINSV